MPKRKERREYEDVSRERMRDYLVSHPDKVIEYMDSSWNTARDLIIESAGMISEERRNTIMREAHGKVSAIEDILGFIAHECRKIYGEKI